MVTFIKRGAQITMGLGMTLGITSSVWAGSLPPPLRACTWDVAPVSVRATATQRTGVPAPRTVAAQVHTVEGAEITLSTGTTLDGGVQVEGRGADLAFRKKVTHDGAFSLELEAPHDKVAVAFDEHTILVTRDRNTVKVGLAVGLEQDLEKVRRMLADSQAVRLFRTGATAILESNDDSSSAASVLMADALVGVLTGDEGAPGRIARHLSRHARSRVRPAAMQMDCYSVWETSVLIASYEWEECEHRFSIWDPTRHLCAFRWLLQVESYWFAFIACSGFPRL